MKGIRLVILLLLASVYGHAQHWAPLPFQFDKRVTALIPDSEGDSMFITGSFQMVNNTPANVIKWDGDTGITYLSLFNGGGYVDDITTYNGKMFTCWGGIIARKDDTGMYWTNNPNRDQANKFFRIGERLAVGMEHWDGTSAFPAYINLAVWDGAVWKDTLRFDTIATRHYPYISSIAYYNGQLYVASNNLTAIANPLIEGVVRFDGTKWTDVGGGVNRGGAGYIARLLVYHGSLYICGSFFEKEGAPGNHIARWDGTAWHSLGSGLSAGYGHGATDMAVYNDALYVVGNFSQAGGVPAHGLAKWDGKKWCAVGDDFGGGAPDQIAAFRGNMYVSGGWTTINNGYCDYMGLAK